MNLRVRTTFFFLSLLFLLYSFVSSSARSSSAPMPSPSHQVYATAMMIFFLWFFLCAGVREANKKVYKRNENFVGMNFDLMLCIRITLNLVPTTLDEANRECEIAPDQNDAGTWSHRSHSPIYILCILSVAFLRKTFYKFVPFFHLQFDLNQKGHISMLTIIRRPDQRFSETFLILDLHLIAHNNAITWEIVIFLNGIMRDVTKEANFPYSGRRIHQNPSHE